VWNYFFTYYWVYLIVCRSYPIFWMKAFIVFEEVWAWGRSRSLRVVSDGLTLILVLEKEWSLVLLRIVAFQEVSMWHAWFKTCFSVTVGKRFLLHHNFWECTLLKLVLTCWWSTFFHWISTRVNSDRRLMCDWMDRHSQFFKIFRRWTVTFVD